MDVHYLLHLPSYWLRICMTRRTYVVLVMLCHRGSVIRSVDTVCEMIHRVYAQMLYFLASLVNY